MTNIVVKPVGTEISLTTANTVANSMAVRLCNNTAASVLITVAGSTPGTFTVLANSVVVLKKTPTDTVASSSAIPAAPVAWL